jgi:hypothetical protein
MHLLGWDSSQVFRFAFTSSIFVQFGNSLKSSIFFNLDSSILAPSPLSLTSNFSLISLKLGHTNVDP